MSIPVFKIHSNKRFYLVGSKVISKQDKLNKEEYIKATEFIREHGSEFKNNDEDRRETLLGIDLEEIDLKDFFKIVSDLKQEYNIEEIIKKYFKEQNIVLTVNEVKSFLMLC